MKRKAAISIFLVVGIVALATYLLTYDARNHNRMLRLLEKDSGVAITELVINYQKRQVICRDQETLQYFHDLIRGDFKRPKGGTTYDIDLKCSDSTTISALMYVADGSIEIDVGGGISKFGDSVTVVQVGVPNETPANFKIMFDFLMAPNEEEAGHRLVLHSNGAVERTNL